METMLLAFLFSNLHTPVAEAAPPAAGRSAALRGHEIAFELGTTHDASSNAEFLHGGEAASSQGLRLGFGLGEHLSLIGGWHRSRYGQEIILVSDSTEWTGDGGLRSQFVLDQLSAGVKVRREVRPWLQPYANAQLVLARAEVRLDDASEEDENPNELRAKGLAPGAMVMAGLEVDPLRAFGGRLGSYLELGYDYTLPLHLRDEAGHEGSSGGDEVELGDVRLQGFALRWGVGYRF